MNICLDLIPFIIKYSEINTINWQKLIGIECLVSICQNPVLLKIIYDKRFNKEDKENCTLYDDLINCVTKISYTLVNAKLPDNFKKTMDKKENKPHSLIEHSNIFTETDQTAPVINVQQNMISVVKMLLDIYTYWKDSYVFILEANNIKLGKSLKNLNQTQQLCQEFLCYGGEFLKNAMTALLVNSIDDSITQSYLNIFQSYITIFGSLSLANARDSYLNDLCKLAIPNNLGNLS